MRLTALNPHWIGAGGAGITDSLTGKPVPQREGVMLGFDCPCGSEQCVGLYLRNPVDGGPPVDRGNAASWQRTGDSFETLTLEPSIQRADPNGCRCHFFIRNGQIVYA